MLHIDSDSPLIEVKHGDLIYVVTTDWDTDREDLIYTDAAGNIHFNVDPHAVLEFLEWEAGLSEYIEAGYRLIGVFIRTDSSLFQSPDIIVHPLKTLL